MMMNSLRKYLLPIVIAMVFVGVATASILTNGTETNTEEGGVKWITFEELNKLQKKNPRKVVFDVYTDWCGWCKKMDKSTFADPTVGKFANEKFYAVKLNAESKKVIKYQGREMTEQELAASWRVTGYPTTVYLDEKMNLIEPRSGYLDVNQFMLVLKFYGGDHHKSQTIEQFAQTQQPIQAR
jgi:thioredoxin-related protein